MAYDLAMTDAGAAARREEAADNERLAKAKAAVEHYKQKEDEAIRQLAQARSSLKNVREKCEALFMECQERAVKRRKSGLIEYVAGY